MMPKMLRRAGSLSKPSNRSGAERWKKLSAWLCTNCAKCTNWRSLTAVGGGATAIMASQALADASWWLIGQMPQMRAVMPGIS